VTECDWLLSHEPLLFLHDLQPTTWIVMIKVVNFYVVVEFLPKIKEPQTFRHLLSLQFYVAHCV